MNERKRLIRKVLYVLGITVLLIPIWSLASPELTDAQGQLVRGGTLAKIRHDNKLSQSNLGEIDPASETVKLATLGLKGIAVNLLWGQANEYKKKENWTALSATLEQIRKLVPNFISVWQFQAWNLTYNVSVEFDDFRDRYRWVIRGINFLREGTKYNVNNPPLLWDMGWTISQKIGRADEHVQYRKLFKADDEFHGSRPLSKRDNWLVGREWFLEGERVVDTLGVPISGLNPLNDPGQKRGKSPLIFYSDSAMCLINYADAMEDEGTFGEVAQAAWRKAGEAWKTYGNRPLNTTYNISIRLNDKELNDERAAKALAELKALLPAGTEEKVREEKIAKLSKREQAALNTPADKRNADQQNLMYIVDDKTKVRPTDLAERADEPNRTKALALADEVMSAENLSGIIDRYRQIVNFEYWRMRCDVERNDDTLAARKLIYQANKDLEAARISESVKLFEEGFLKWRAVIDKFPKLLDEGTFAEDLLDHIKAYRRNLDQLERKMPDDFPLKDVLEHSQESAPAAESPPSDENAAPAEEAEQPESKPAE